MNKLKIFFKSKYNKLSNYVNHLGIRTKLIFIFVFIKIVPLVIIAWIAIAGANGVAKNFASKSKDIVKVSKKIIKNTADIAISDSIRALDKKSQDSLERLSHEVALKVAAFLYNRDKDLLFLASLPMSSRTIKNFYNHKNRKITVHEPYYYDDKTNSWKSSKPFKIKKEKIQVNNKENEKEFHRVTMRNIKKVPVPIYKEITYYNLAGQEIYKVSQIDSKLKNISNPKNTYVKAETYYKESLNLKKGEIYVSDQIGAYVSSRLIGPYIKPRTKKAGLAFKPKESAYAGKENPVGKRYEGIIRFVTPVYSGKVKKGYLTLALDHRHLKEFVDYLETTEGGNYGNIKDASRGNYAFIWDYLGRNIVHPREFFIVGYNPKTGKQVPSWLSNYLYKKWQESGIKDFNHFTMTIKDFHEQTIKKKGSKVQYKKGQLGLDCRYLDFAPQCKGWFQLTEKGGYGSFIIFWTGVWKLTTAATIPYYTGKYANSHRGFGFVTLGANVEEFHKAATATKTTLDMSLQAQTAFMEQAIKNNEKAIVGDVQATVTELFIASLLMIAIVVVIAIAMSNSMTRRLKALSIGVKEIANDNLSYRIDTKYNDEIGLLGRSFNHMAESMSTLMDDLKGAYTIVSQQVKELKKMDELKDEFLANTSHELRTPLTGIIGIAESLLDGAAGELSDEQKQNMSLVIASGKRLAGLVNDILDFSKLKNHDLELQIKAVSLREAVDVVLTLSKVLLLGKKLELINEVPAQLPFVAADENRLQQILYNIIGNAVKFTKEGFVKVSAAVEGDFVKVKIEDSGIGISSDKIKDIFKSFEQAEGSIAREYGGTGLGLSITKQLIELHKGEITVESKEGFGSTFYFTLPITEQSAQTVKELNLIHEQIKAVADLDIETASKEEQEQENEAPVLSKSDKNENGFTILAVDDEPVNLQVLENQLSLHNYKVLKAANGEDALAVLENNEDIDLVLLDVMMPKVSGYDVCKKIRESKTAYELPIIMLTAKSSSDDISLGLKLGANDYLGKPFSKNELLSRVKTHLDLKKAIHESKVSIKKEQQILLQNIINNNPSLIYAREEDGSYLLANKPFAKIFNLKEEEILGNKIHFILEKEIADAAIKTDREVFESKQIIETEDFIRTVDAEYTFYTVKFPIFDIKGNVYAVGGISTDITKIKETEKEMLKLNKELEHAKDKAEAATLAKSRFLANMSHEIRTPMNAVIGLTHLLAKTPLNSKQREYVSKVAGASTHLLGIINDILDFSKIEAGKLEMEEIPFDLNDVMYNLSDLVSLKAADKGVELVFYQDSKIPVKLIGDPLRLGQVLLNLTNNAVKFTSDGEIKVSIRGVKLSDDEAILEFSVKDSGIGLTQEQQGKLFQSFTQADSSTTRKFGGTGLGLSISKKLVQMMGGDIRVESEVGSGADFLFTARFKVQENAAKKRPIIPKEIRNMRVLVVDDNQSSIDVLENYLNDFGFDVSTSLSGSDALEKLYKASAIESDPYKLVLVDWKMPDMDGFATADRIIKAYPEKKSRPKLIMVTGYGREEVISQVNQAGLDGFLIKPVAQSLLYDTVIQSFSKNSGKKTFEVKDEKYPKDFDKIRGAKILLVEDNEINQQVAKEILEGEGFWVDIAENGQVAVQKVLGSDPGSYDIVLMDLQMPVKDGYEASKEIREDKRFDDLPIVAMTADAMAGVKEQVFEVKMNDYIPKPINPTELYEALVRWISFKEREHFKVKEDVHTDKAQLKELIFEKLIDFNVAAGLDRIKNNLKLYYKLLNDFSKDNYDLAEKIAEHIEKGDIKTAQRLAHTVKGTAGNIGAEKIHFAATKMDYALKNEVKEDYEGLIYKLSEAIKPAIEQVRALVNQAKDLFEESKTDNEPKELGDINNLLPILEEQLYTALKKSKPKDVKELLEEIFTFEWKENVYNSLKSIADLSTDYKFRDARKILDTLIEDLKGAQ